MTVAEKTLVNGRPIQGLSLEMHNRVCEKLRDRGFEASVEHPGYISVDVGPFYIMLGQHCWDIAMVEVIFPSPNELHQIDCEPLPIGERWLNTHLPETCHDAEAIAEAWAGEIRLFAAHQHVCAEHVA